MVIKLQAAVLALYDTAFTLHDMNLPRAYSSQALIRARALSGFDELTVNLGGDPLALLNSVGLSPRDLENPENCIALEKVARLIENAAVEMAIADFGLRLAGQQDISVLGAVALIAQYSATVSEALAGIARHLPYHTPDAELKLKEDPARPGYIRICYQLSLNDDWPRRQTMELSYSIMRHFLLLLTGDQGADWHLSFRHSAGCHADVYKRHGFANAVFSQHEDALIVPAHLLGTAIDANDNLLRAAAERFLSNLIRRYPLDVTRQVETLVERQLASGGSTLQRIAAQLGLHERTLQRRLHEQGSFFEDIVDRLRQQRARTLLLDTALPLAEIASVLGYSEQSSLNRSCSRWFGTSPKALRKSQARPA